MRLKDYLLVIPMEDFIYVGYEEGIKFPNTEIISELLSHLKQGIQEEVFYSQYSNHIVKKVIEILEKKNFIVYEEYDKYEDTIFSRNFYYYERFKPTSIELHNKLSKASVCIIGLGGIGGNILQMLMAAGVQSFHLIDFDKVESHNLNRQFLYRVEDIGKYKIDVCKDYIMNFNPKSNIKLYKERIVSLFDLTHILKHVDIDIIIQCGDYPSNINSETLLACKELKVPMISGGVGIDFGFFELLDVEKIEKTKENYMVDNYAVPKGSFGTTNSIIASYMAHDITHYLMGEMYFSKFGRMVIKFPR